MQSLLVTKLDTYLSIPIQLLKSNYINEYNIWLIIVTYLRMAVPKDSLPCRSVAYSAFCFERGITHTLCEHAPSAVGNCNTIPKI